MAVKLGLVLAIVCTLYVHTYAQSSCISTLIGLSPCLTYISGNSSTPAAACCSGLASVVATMPQCLCQVIGSNAGSSFGININQTQALSLPAACNVNTPNPSLCSTLAGAPTSSSTSPPPVGAPPASVSTPASAPDSPSSGSGSTTTPAVASPAPSHSGISMNSAPSLMVLTVMFLVSSASTLRFF